MKNTEFIRKLPIPMDIKKEYPVSEKGRTAKEKTDAELKDIFTGRSDRFLLVIGPCSADREDAVMEYLGRLRKTADRVSDRLLIIPRLYTNKPRTTGDGYKGMLHQPDPNESPDMLLGLTATRKLHLRALNETGFSCADELLYPENHRYLSDLVSYIAVGARSVEDQQHRLTASGLSIPVGMKNPTEGDLTVMMNAVRTARHPHTFIYRGWEVKSEGNPFSHAVLRGYVDRYGRNFPNYHYEDLMKTIGLFSEMEIPDPAVVVDVNHSNSGKNFLEQIRISREVLWNRKNSGDIRKCVKGLMIESYLKDGKVSAGDTDTYGRSITDPCLGWKKTEKLIYEIADLV